ncbi:MAG: family 78 glycoside hydrolase catalytic domain [Novosphingobium sp.]|nr:family 78 glycoside hydrolase catalytic domain [Novosphingobium sp.]
MFGICAATPSHAAEWITAPEARTADDAKQEVALDFRRNVSLDRKPQRFLVRVSADQRFVLYVNGVRAAAGPARGDLAHWRYEEIDLAPYLRRGENIVAAKVWSDGRNAARAQISAGITAFSLAAVDPAQAALIDTGAGWRVRIDHSRSVGNGLAQLNRQVGQTYYVSGGPETIDAAMLAQDWNAPHTASAGWQPAATALDGPAPWQMVRDALPQMRYDRVPSGHIVRSSGLEGRRFPAGKASVPAHSEATVLIDAGRVLAAYPVLRVSGGAGAEVTLTYTEALYDPVKRSGGARGPRVRFEDRARVDDGLALGLTDSFRPDGAQNREFAPFWWRAWRFVEIRVKTGDDPLTLDGLETYETGYPFAQKGRFVSNDEELNHIWQIGWKTALLDAHETYMDTAYWEQLQYIGDTRLQMLLSYDVAGDPRLAVQALEAFDHSRQGDGLPQAAWPQAGTNVIPPFALLWIGAVHDFWMRQPDTSVVTRALPGMRAVLDWYAPYLRESGIVRPTPDWPFIDWQPGLDGMTGRNGKGPDSCIITMQYYGALRDSAQMEDALGDSHRAAENRTQMGRVAAGLQSQCWDAARGLYADTPDKATFSQHANALAVLFDLVPANEQRTVLDKIVLPGWGIAAPEGIVGTTYYFSYYLARALDHAGMSDRYLDLMQTWRGLLARNFTTWPEQLEPSRSDSHAWSSHPTSGLLTYVAGIQPDAPGFSKVKIAPHLGNLHTLDAAMAHPGGLIETRYSLQDGRLHATVKLPAGLSGSFVWAGQVHPLHPGSNRIRINTENAE